MKDRNSGKDRRERSGVRSGAQGGPPRGQRSGHRRDDIAPAAKTNIIFGTLPVLEALRSNPQRIDRLIFAEGVREQRLAEIHGLARSAGILVDRFKREKLDRITAGQNHQGVIAFTAAADYVDADEILENAGEPPLLLLLDGVEDPRNLGAVLRSAECAGADGVFIPERRAVGLTDSVAKSAAGATEYVRVAKVGNLNRLIERLKEQNIWVVGTSGTAETDYTEWDWNRPSAIVLGSEGSGLHRLVAENCDMLVKIPMYGKIDSLNVSVAAGVILFEARRQRQSSGE